jgi:hypothetical protein
MPADLAIGPDDGLMVLVAGNVSIEQLDMAVHALGQAEIVSDSHDGLAVIVNQIPEDFEYLFARLRIQ